MLSILIKSDSLIFGSVFKNKAKTTAIIKIKVYETKNETTQLYYSFNITTYPIKNPNMFPIDIQLDHRPIISPF